jgi:ribosomal protein S18 acetylase RimI-like enzyme
MHELALEQRRVLGLRAQWHVGDITWGLRQHEGREPEWTFRLRKDGGRVVAWSWLKSDRGILEHDVHGDHLHLLDEILDEPEARSVSAFEDDAETRAAFARYGFTRPERAFRFHTHELPEAPDPRALPDGFRLRTAETADLAERVAVHRDVWAPSRVTESSYANVMASWPYRSSLDCVVEGPDRRFAAYVLIWPDDVNGVGLFEPVGTREEFRRLGLGAAVCTFALQRMHEEGLRQAVVLCESDAACALYESVGFRRHATSVLYTR